MLSAMIRTGYSRSCIAIYFGAVMHWPASGQLPIRSELRASDIVNAADYRAGGVVPGEIVVVYPSNAGPPGMVPWGLTGDPTTTTLLGETSVLFDGVPANIVYSVRGQIGAIVPQEVAGKKTTNVVVEYQGQRSPPATVAVIDSTPALFTLDASGKGQAAMLNETGCCNSIRNPAVRGKLASLYATGEGIARNISVTVGGVPAQIFYSGNPGAALQVNFRVPPNAPVGDAVPLVLRVGKRQSSSAVTMAVRSARRRVLVLQNNAVIRRRLVRILAKAGYKVSTTQQAMEQSDLAILDLAMPKEETSEIIEALRKARPQLRIMTVSSALDADALRTADLLGAQAVLTQPFTALKVRSRVRALLEMRPAVY
jgi:uncharacterized protein (TIGR03437 family)